MTDEIGTMKLWNRENLGNRTPGTDVVGNNEDPEVITEWEDGT